MEKTSCVALAYIMVCFLPDVVGETDALKRGIQSGPLNDAQLVNSSIVLECEATDEVSRITWAEYATGYPDGVIISIGTVVLPDHPNAGRYEIVHSSPTTFNLLINDTVLEDGGKYRCTDVNIPEDAFAQLVMIRNDPICISTIPADGAVVEGRYYTINCSVDYRADSTDIAPIMTWTGPSPFDVETSTTDATVWSRVGFRATSSMTGAQFSCKTYFTDDGFDEADSATNAPAYEHVYYSETIISVNPSPYAGVTYIRWGRKVCGEMADILYTGWTAAAHSSHAYGGSDYVCLPAEMEWGTVFGGQQGAGSYHYPAEYEVSSAGTPFSFINNNGISIQDYEAPCVTCLTNRTTQLMIAGRTSCPTGWTMEYRGYLASEKYPSGYRTSQVCVDEAPETFGSAISNGWGMLSVIEVYCHSLGSPCGSYWELACIVCTK